MKSKINIFRGSPRIASDEKEKDHNSVGITASDDNLREAYLKIAEYWSQRNLPINILLQNALTKVKALFGANNNDVKLEKNKK